MLLVYGFFTAILLGIPLLNTKVFRTVNVEEVKREARVHVDSINTLKEDGLYTQMREYCLRVDSIYGKRKDAPSVFLAQYAFFHAGLSHQMALEYEESIELFERMLEKYPTTLFAEQIFFLSGQSLYLAKNYPEAIRWFERLEMNRELAQSFPKYRNRPFKPGLYVNLDELGRKKEEHSRIYTNQERLKDIRGRKSDQGGNLLSDAVVRIGEAYMAMGESDSARAQFSLIQKYFPDSDRLDDIQLFIADSYFADAQKARQEAENAKGPEAAALKKRMEIAYRNAEAEYQRFLNRFPESELASKAYIQLGAIRFAHNDPAGAEKIFRDAISNLKVIERQAEVQLQIGHYYRTSGADKKSLEAYSKVVQNYPTTRQAGNAQFLVGLIHEDAKDTAKAMQAFEAVTVNFRSSVFFPEAAYRLAKKYLNAGDDKNAEKFFTQIVVSNPSHVIAPRSWYELGLISMKRKGHLEAINRFEFAIGDGASSIADQATLKIAESWRALGDSVKAEQTLGRVKDETLKDELYWEGEGSKEPPQKRLEKIVFNLERKKDPKDKAFWYEQMMNVRVEMGQYDSALLALDSAILLHKEKLRKIALGVTKAQLLTHPNLKAYDSSRAYLNELLQMRGLGAMQRAKIEYEIAEAYRKEGRRPPALAGYRKLAGEYAASNDEKERLLAANAQNHLAQLLLEEGKADSAFAEYERFIKTFPDNEHLPDAILGAGEALIAKGELDRAASYVDERLEKFKEKDALKGSGQKIGFELGELFSKLYAESRGGAPAAGKEDEAKNPAGGNAEGSRGAGEGKALPVPSGAGNAEPEKLAARAEAGYRRALEGDSLSHYYSAAAYGLGNLKSAQGRDGEAVAAFERVQKEQPSYYKAARNQISKILAKKDWKAALAHLNEAVTLSERDYQNHVQKNEEDAARQSLRETAIATLEMGHIYSEQKMYRDAARTFAKVYDKYNEADTGITSAALIYGLEALRNANQIEEVKRLADRMARDYPNSPYLGNALYTKAAALYQGGTRNGALFPQAYKAFQDFIQHMEEKGRRDSLTATDLRMLQAAYYQRADCVLGQKRYPEAVKAYEASVQRFPRGEFKCNALFQQANAYLASQQPEKAVKKYEEVNAACGMGAFPLHCKNLALWGQTLIQAGDTRKATQVLNNCKSRCRSEAEDYRLCQEHSQALLINH